LQRVRGKGLVLVPPKTKAGVRDVKLGQKTLERLAAHREEQELQKLAIGNHWEDNGLIFTNPTGKPVTVEVMYDRFKRLLKDGGLPDIRFHDLRHTSISFLLDMGTSVNTVQQRAGHSKASVTTDTYGHAVAHSQDEAAEKLEERFTPVAVKLLSK
jgi:integrase